MTYLNGLRTSELESRVSRLPAHSAIYYLMVNRNADGGNVHPLEYMERLAAIANSPIYCWVDSAMDRGIVGGSLKDQTGPVSEQPTGARALPWGSTGPRAPRPRAPVPRHPRARRQH